MAIEIPTSTRRPTRVVATYEELARWSRSIASRLPRASEAEPIVAILAERASPLAFAAQLAASRAGAAFVSLESSFPDEQLRQILEDAAPIALLIDPPNAERARSARLDASSVIDLAEAANGAGLFSDLFEERAAGSDLAYLIYTSGTTGRPKGVMIEHAGLLNLIESDRREFALTPDDRCAQGSSLAYDSSIEEIWLAWGAGGAVVVMDDEAVRAGPDVTSWLQRERITVWCPPPTLLRATGCQNPETVLPDLRLLYVGGEALPQDVADRWAKERRLVNGYGPTEVTVTSVRTDVHAGEAVSIGRPISGVHAWVLNEAFEETADGTPGELCLGGVALARGYRHLPDLTAQKFPVHARLGRLYRTGDLVHRDPSGALFYHGRLDAQVKLRGYRIELEAIETRLAECEGVAEAACAVVGEGARQSLAAFVVPSSRTRAPAADALKAALSRVLPAYMVPFTIATVDALPRTLGGKIDRRALASLRTEFSASPSSSASVRSPVVDRIASAMGGAADKDFFVDLGGDSLQAALLISTLRQDAATASLTVRDVYEARTAERLAERVAIASGSTRDDVPATDAADRIGVYPTFVTLMQGAFILTGILAASALAYLAAFVAFPRILDRWGIVPVVIALPALIAASIAIYIPIGLACALLIKRVVMGRYTQGRRPVWSLWYLRHWIVQESVRMLVPWRFVEGTLFQQMALRALGARIGRRVHIHRGVSLLRGGWDVLEIGDDVTVRQDASIRVVELEAGHVVIGPVTLGAGCTLDVRAGVAPDTDVGAGAYLAALSSLPSGGRVPAGERWDGIPAAPAGQAPERAKLTTSNAPWSQMRYGAVLLFSRAVLGLVLSLPFQIVALVVIDVASVDGPRALRWLADPLHDAAASIALLMSVLVSVPMTVAIAALAARALGPVRPGVIDRWSGDYLRVWLKSGLVTAAGEWLSGTLFWPSWLRAAGMRVGRGCEISTIIDVVPELVTIGDETFLADGIYLGGPAIHRGAVTLAPVRLGRNVFLGNHVVIAVDREVSDDVLLGVCTVASEGAVPGHTSWFGHPPFALPRREIVEMSRDLTHEPSWIRYVNRVIWEAGRATLPIVPVLVALAWYDAIVHTTSRGTSLVVAVPAISFAAAVALVVIILALKWALLGRVKPARHALWSCWCSRWDFLYVAWGLYARGLLSSLEGTLWLSMCLRATGMTIGRRVVLGSGFAQVVDPDMLVFEDDATVDCQFQAHTFEDRVLKIDRVRIRRGASVGSGAVLLYGADVGSGAQVAAHSVVMKMERLADGARYEGAPTRIVRNRASPS